MQSAKTAAELRGRLKASCHPGRKGDKLVATEPHQGIRRPECGRHAGGQSDDDLVSDIMPEAVVDALEFIHIQQDKHPADAGVSRNTRRDATMLRIPIFLSISRNCACLAIPILSLYSKRIFSPLLQQHRRFPQARGQRGNVKKSRPSLSCRICRRLY